MRLHRAIAEHIDTIVWLDEVRVRECSKATGVSEHDIDPTELVWDLENLFPRTQDGLGREFDWGEIRATVQLALWRHYRPCRIGWHRWGMFDTSTGKATCFPCGTQRAFTPRWVKGQGQK